MHGIGSIAREYQGEPAAHAESDDSDPCPVRRSTSSTAPLMSRAAWSICIAIIAFPASSGSRRTFVPVVEVRGQRDEPGGGEAVTHVLDVVDEAPPLLDHDDPGTLPLSGVAR